MFRLNQSKKRTRNGINRKLWSSIFRTIYEWKMYNNFKHERENNNKGEKNIASVLHHFDFFFFKFCCLFAATTRCSAITIGCICTICVLSVHSDFELHPSANVLFCHWFLCSCVRIFWGEISSVQGISACKKNKELSWQRDKYRLNWFYARLHLPAWVRVCVCVLGVLESCAEKSFVPSLSDCRLKNWIETKPWHLFIVH